MYKLTFQGNFCKSWVDTAGHCGITGNEIADKAAKHAMKTPDLDIENTLNKSEFNYVLKKHCYQKNGRKQIPNWDTCNLMYAKLTKAP